LVSILHVVVFHRCSLGSLNKDRLVDLCCGRTCQGSEQVVFISLSRTTKGELYLYLYSYKIQNIRFAMARYLIIFGPNCKKVCIIASRIYIVKLYHILEET